MNKLTQTLLLTVLLPCINSLVVGAEVTDNFSTGATLRANSMNNIKNAVNDNNSRIGALESSNSDTLSRLSCTNGQVAKFNGSSWACGNDSDTSYNGGTGVNISDTTISIDSNSVQARVSGSCPVNQSIRSINKNGSVVCEVDSNSTYFAGAGIRVQSNRISLAGSIKNVTQGDDIVISDTYEEILSITFNAPSNGFVHVHATGRSRCLNNAPAGGPAFNNLSCEVYAAISDATNIAEALQVNRAYTFFQNLDDGQAISIPFAAQALYPVTTGNNTLYFLAKQDSHPLVLTSIRDSQMIVTFHAAKM